MITLKARAFYALIPLAALVGCRGGSDLTTASPTQPVGSVASSTTGGQTSQSFNVTRCMDQVADGNSVRNIMIPDVVTFDPARPAGYPNGRRLQDPVIDIMLAYLFLDLTRHTPTTLVNVPLNPNRLDQPLRLTFPYYAAPIGSPPISATNGSNFNFRTNLPADYLLFERAAVPAVSTINVLGPRKIAYNEATPLRDSNREFEADIVAGLENLTVLIFDDLQRLGLTPCATPR